MINVNPSAVACASSSLSNGSQARQLWQHKHVAAFDGQILTIIGKLPRAHRRCVDTEIGTGKTRLNHNLPNARDAAPKCFIWLKNRRSRVARQKIVAERRPEQGVSIEQKVQSVAAGWLALSDMSGISSIVMLSNSSGTEAAPFMYPMHCGRRGSIFSTFAKGLRAVAMMKDAPRIAISTRFERFVLASSILKLFMIDLNLVNQTLVQTGQFFKPE